MAAGMLLAAGIGLVAAATGFGLWVGAAILVG
jgi:hypothetical protein